MTAERSRLMTIAANEQEMIVAANEQEAMKRVVVDHYGGPEVLGRVGASGPLGR
jgi:hypothetical protein